MGFLIVFWLFSVVLSVFCGVIDNRIDSYSFADGTCNLPDALVKEIEGYQPIVNKIVKKAVDGDFAGKTWERLVIFIILQFLHNFISSDSDDRSDY